MLGSVRLCELGRPVREIPASNDCRNELNPESVSENRAIEIKKYGRSKRQLLEHATWAYSMSRYGGIVGSFNINTVVEGIDWFS